MNLVYGMTSKALRTAPTIRVFLLGEDQSIRSLKYIPEILPLVVTAHATEKYED
jgi:hypothetical protein